MSLLSNKVAIITGASSGIGRASLIAIQGSAPWWEGHGFRAALTTPALDARLAGYGSDVRYMSRQSETARSS